MTRIPTAFLSHGAPTLALDATSGADFARWGATLPSPRAVLVVSAHWQRAPATIGTATQRELLYDFHGFPPELYRMRYDAPAAAQLADELQQRIPGIARDDRRPWDHGVWVPLLHVFPQADVPVLQLSLPSAGPAADLLELGRRLAPLRDEGVLLLGSGGAVHNLGGLDWRGTAPPPAWATEFEAWLRERVAARAFDDLADWRALAPGAALAHPTPEHYLPLLVVAGAAIDDPDPPRFPIEGFEFGSLSRLAIEFGA